MFIPDPSRRLPSGRSLEGQWQQINKVAGAAQFGTAEMVALRQWPKIPRRLITPIGAGLAVLKYDPAKAWPAGAALAKVRVDDDAVATGITIGGTVYKATPGKWLALRDVPATPTLPAHIPSFDTRADNDPENPANFWEFVTPATICLPGQDAIEI